MDNVKQWLSARRFIYSWLALCYRGEVKAGLDILSNTAIMRELSEYQRQPAIVDGARKMMKEMNEQKNNDKYPELLASDCQRLFVGPGPVLAPPWESVYRTRDKLLFGEPDDAVRKIYLREGLVVNQAEPADHIALELAFMARVGALAPENSENAAEIMNIQCSFLKEHLLSWVPDWQKDVTCNAETHFWSGLAMITKGWIIDDFANRVSISNA